MSKLQLTISLNENIEINTIADISKTELVSNLKFCLKNTAGTLIKLKKLAFTFIYPLKTGDLSNAKMSFKEGTYIELTNNDELLALAPNEVWEFSGKVNARLNQYSDMPTAFFVIDDSDDIHEVNYSKKDKLATSVNRINASQSAELSVTQASDHFDNYVNAEFKESHLAQKSRTINCFPKPQNIILSTETVDLSLGFTLEASAEFAQQFSNMQQIEADLNTQQALFKVSDLGVLLVLSEDSSLATNAYQLTIETKYVKIRAADVAGIHNALVSLWQIATNDMQKVTCLTIQDSPRFEWRGQHLDTARQFFSIAEIKNFINNMSLYKLNKFHWHLVDDEAWRVEIKACPELTAKLSERGYNQLLDPQYGSAAPATGGYYSQAQMREIVDYAKARNIEVIPEIDIPGHCFALMKLYPELNEAADASVYRSVQGYANNCLNPALPATYEFLEKVLSEVAAVFPCDYLHIGADERPEGTWENSPAIKALMQQQGFDTTEQVQTYFLRNVQQILKKLGKKTAAWEEASEQGEIEKDGYVVSWKGTQAGINALKKGYQVVMAPAQHCYFDIAQSNAWGEPGQTWINNYVPLRKVYEYNPLSQALDPSVYKNLKGVQGCLWGENLYDKSLVQHLLFPRIIALSEIAWTEHAQQNYAQFERDLKQLHQPTLERLKINYCKLSF